MNDRNPDSELRPGTSGREAVQNAACLTALREEVISSLGIDYGAGVLYGIGFIEGLVDGIRVMRRFSGEYPPEPGAVGPGLPLLFQPESQTADARVSGALSESLEARIHMDQQGEALEPTCYVSAGYAAGWYSEIFRQTILVRELECEACGDKRCHFVARTLADWEADGDRWIAALLPYLDFEHLRVRAEELSRDPTGICEADEQEYDECFTPEGDMLGNFDPMSPAAHIWGPVMVLPYSGFLDGGACLESIIADLGPGQVRVVVLDVAGAQIGGVEAADLTRLLDRLESLGLETIVSGLAPGADHPFRNPDGGLAMPLLARDIVEAIALGFQLTLASRDTQ
jgi:hypothetical protein